MKDSTIKKIAFWSGVAGLAMILYVSGRAHAATSVSDPDNNAIAGQNFKLHCSGKTPQSVADQCLVEMRKRCPEGGKFGVTAESMPGEKPMFIDLLVICKHEPPW